MNRRSFFSGLYSAALGGIGGAFGVLLAKGTVCNAPKQAADFTADFDTTELRIEAWMRLGVARWRYRMDIDAYHVWVPAGEGYITHSTLLESYYENIDDWAQHYNEVYERLAATGIEHLVQPRGDMALPGIRERYQALLKRVADAQA